MKLVNKPKNNLVELSLKAIELVKIHYQRSTRYSVWYSSLYVIIALESFEMSKYSSIDSLSVESNRMYVKRPFSDNQKITADRFETHTRSVLDQVSTDKLKTKSDQFI